MNVSITRSNIDSNELSSNGNEKFMTSINSPTEKEVEVSLLA